MEIKLIGFIKQHDYVDCAEDFSELHTSKSLDLSPSRKAFLISYLSNAEPIFAWMDYFSDIKTGTIVAPHGYRSDGEWIWPSYLPYYIAKYNLWEHYENFLQSIESGKAKASLLPNQIKELSSFLLKKIQ